MNQTKNRFIALLLAAVLAVGAAGCGSSSGSSAASSAASASAAASSSVQKTTIKIDALKGPTGLGMVKLMQDAENAKSQNDYHFTLDTAPDAAVAKLTSGEADIAAMPTNMAALLYKKTSGNVQMLAVNTLGILSVVTNGETVSSIKDLKGKTVYSSGQGGVPEYAFDYILQQNGLTPGKDVKVEYLSEHAEVVSRLLSGKAKIAVLPEPFVTQTLTKCKTAKAALNLTKEWDKVVKDGSVLSMGCLAVRKDFAQQHKEALHTFLKEYQSS
ncbi:MAG: PhnD/SsuA/transferrin family substrate-binding protein, partial [Oscillospiraceae bacterium]|nr:PhnD/SsuA/transferrin family substrate-binding protein [Oscillospiraceae bacterium]